MICADRAHEMGTGGTAARGFCGDYPPAHVVDPVTYDFAECYRDAVLFGVPCAFIAICGTWHTVCGVHTFPRRKGALRLRAVERIVFAVSLLLAVRFLYVFWHVDFENMWWYNKMYAVYNR